MAGIGERWDCPEIYAEFRGKHFELLSTPPLDSEILWDCPEIFAEFRGKHFEILWRGSRDGFWARKFHRHCDGHSNILTVILDSGGNIFGGFTPLQWESTKWRSKADYGLKSFLFTLQNPHSLPARRFALKGGWKPWGVSCDSERGPVFGGGWSCEIIVSDNCSTNNDSFSSIGHSYTNDTGLNGNIVFTGSRNFKVTEIEVFKITN
jgi:hypothetical protein